MQVNASMTRRGGLYVAEDQLPRIRLLLPLVGHTANEGFWLEMEPFFSS